LKNNAKPGLNVQFKPTVEGTVTVMPSGHPMNDHESSTSLIDKIISTSLGLAAGFLIKKIIVGRSTRLFRKIMGAILQFEVTNVIAQHPGSVQSSGRFIMKQLNHKKKGASNSRGRERV
jgi:hypothetical protein